ncbi:HAMP domain-containing protein [Bacillus sp. FJAT-49705]|uniref:histidine kinase n=1 Tax=Cytobacillus citreus TaxID=2833586 RepID=A0ABS5NWI1_9BACI|nr:PAS domain-containing sensor histidine kinase [Cytobacillus citreus]MBS4192191.1 HAMP domain-containing protein [Cytobacillus citreus]
MMIKRLINWFLSQPIRIKVLAFGVIMSTIPLLFISYYYYSHVKADLEVRILDKQELMLQILSSEIEMEFNQTFQQLQIFSSLKQHEKNKAAFYELLQQNESIEEVVVTDHKGFVEKKVSRYNLNMPESNEQWFSDKMWLDFQTKNKVYGEVEFNRFGQPVMKLAIPYVENGNRKGIGVIIQLQKTIGHISSLRQEDSAYLYLMDREGNVIAHQDYSKLWQKRTVEKDRNVLGLKTEISDLGWTMVMEQPAETIYEPINNMFQNGLFAVALVTLIVSLISIYAGLYFTTPIIHIEKGMNHLKAGKRPSPIGLIRHDELGKLSQAFNEMSEELQEKSLRLEQEKERLNVVVNGIGAGLALVTKNYNVTWMNPRLSNWLSNEEIQLPCYTLIGGKNVPCENCPITCPDIEWKGEMIMSMNRDGGEDKLFRHRVFALNHAIQDEGEFLVVIEDVTKQKQWEEKIIQTDKLSALGLMASSFAHEVNNPLATINAYAEDLSDRLASPDDELDMTEMSLYLSKIKENTERCKRITSNLLNFSRKTNWTLSQIDVNKTIQNSISLVESSLKKKQIQLKIKIAEELPLLLGDSLKLMQVLVNLINNARDAVEETGEIGVEVKAEENFVSILVIDNGCGISKERLGKIFDPFYTTKPVGKGTGLGLSVCYGIVEEFGGTIEIESKVGIGTTVKVRIPVRNKKREEVQ